MVQINDLCKKKIQKIDFKVTFSLLLLMPRNYKRPYTCIEKMRPNVLNTYHEPLFNVLNDVIALHFILLEC